MKKIIYTLIFLLGLATPPLGAQDFAPGQQAQGLLESKNVTVDHATGIFHYKVPLYTLKSGDFELPITLDYAGKGVKIEDQPGLLGYNWTLNTGGVVTRTVRGGIADESQPYGYARNEKSNTPLSSDLANVNLHKRDGECDIFTAVFGGQSVKFILRMDEDNNTFYAEPLERTNVRIECIYPSVHAINSEIEGWIITDEYGNRYTFRHKEYMKNALKENAVSFNGVHNATYVSSWYLDKIEPLNGQPIRYTYLEEVVRDKKSDNVLTIQYGASTDATYEYGKPWVERNFDFTPYRSDFQTALEQAEAYLEIFGFTLQAQTKMAEFAKHGRWVTNPSFGHDVDALQTHYRIMGHIADFSKISEASAELIQELDKLIAIYKNNSDQNVQMAVLSLRGARNLVIECLEKREETNKRTVTNESYYTVCSPFLHSISCMDKVVTFDYNINSVFSDKLKNVKLMQKDGKMLSARELHYDSAVELSQLAVQDSTGHSLSTLDFAYYPPPTAGSDSLPNGYGCYLRCYLLRSISNSDGGEIHLDYEQNRVKAVNTPSSVYVPDEQGLPYAGMRLRSLVVKDADRTEADTIEYAYPLLGSPLNDYLPWLRLGYQSFTDMVRYERFYKKVVNGYQAAGNEGVYYPYVQERQKGRGCRAYYFAAPFRPYSEMHCYWLYGLPLATVVYDEQENVKQITRELYYASIWQGDEVFGYGAFWEHPSVGYSKQLPQVQADEFYMDADYLSAYYQNQGTTRLYDGVSFNPYEEVYLPNIAPRTGHTSGTNSYTLFYGGKVLQRGQIEYRFEGHVTDSIRYEDFRDLHQSHTPFRQTEYRYDNPEHSVWPTRVIRTDSEGNVRQTLITRVTEMGTYAAEVKEAIASKNMWAQVIKQSEWEGDTLLKEEVKRYEVLEAADSCYVYPAERSLYVPFSIVTGIPIGTDTGWYNYGQDAYQTLERYDYAVTTMGGCLPQATATRSENSTYLYHHISDKPILKAQNVLPGQVAAYNHEDNQGKENGVITAFRSIIQLSKEFQNIYSQLDLSTLPSVAFYLQSEQHQKVLRLINMVATDSYPEDSVAFKSQLDSLINEGIMSEFEYMYMREIIPICPTLIYANAHTWLPALCAFLSRPVEDERCIYHYAYSDELRRLLAAQADVEIVPVSPRMQLYALFYGSKRTVSYSIRYKDGSIVSKSARINTPSTSTQWGNSPYAFGMIDFELENFDQVDAILISPKQEACVFWAIVPQGTEFEATAYYADGSVMARFDQTGTLERYDYDAAGRVTQVSDRHKKPVKGFQYHTVQN